MNDKYKIGANAEINNLNFYNEMHDDNEESAKKSNIECINKILEFANSLPANLRYGNPRLNRGVQDNLDPMGDRKGDLTTDEYALINNEKFKQLVATQHFTNVDPNNVKKSFYKSSTGLHPKMEYENRRPKFTYYIRTKGRK